MKKVHNAGKFYANQVPFHIQFKLHKTLTYLIILLYICSNYTARKTKTNEKFIFKLDNFPLK